MWPLCHHHWTIWFLKDKFYYTNTSWYFKLFSQKTFGLFFQNWIFDIETGEARFMKQMWLSPRSISIRQLHVSPRFHLEPIYLIVFEGSYLLAQWEISS